MNRSSASRRGFGCLLRLGAGLAVTAAVLWHPALAVAQSQQLPREPGGLFGATRPDNAKTRLDLTASLIEGYDSDVPVAIRSTIDPSSLQSGGFTTIFNSNAAYSWRGTRAQVGANANSMLRHYAELGDTRSVGHSAGVGLSLQMPRHTTLIVNQSAAYSPTYLSGLFPTSADIEPGDSGTTAADYSIGGLESYTYTSAVSLQHTLSTRASLAFSGTFDYTDRLDETELWKDVSAHSMRGQYSRQVSRKTALTGQYHYRSGEFGYAGLERTTEHGLEVGLTHTHPLSATRRVGFRFNFGASRADVPELIEGVAVMRRRYLGTGEAEIQYPIGRFWSVRGNLRRGIGYVVDIPEPVLSTGAVVGLDGYVTRRLDVTISAGYTSGDSLMNRGVLAFDTYTGNARVRWALARNLATYAEYLYYFYDFRTGSQALIGFPSGLERNGVRVGMTMWMPTLRK